MMVQSNFYIWSFQNHYWTPRLLFFNDFFYLSSFFRKKNFLQNLHPKVFLHDSNLMVDVIEFFYIIYTFLYLMTCVFWCHFDKKKIIITATLKFESLKKKLYIGEDFYIKKKTKKKTQCRLIKKSNFNSGRDHNYTERKQRSVVIHPAAYD